MFDYYFTDGEGKRILKELVFVTDKREKENKHIIEYFDKRECKHTERALEAGDYTVMLPCIPDLGIMRPVHFANKIFVERKNSIEELCGNLGMNRDRFFTEMKRYPDAEKHLLVEGEKGWEDIIRGKYDSKVTAASLYGSLLALQTRYGLHVHFVPKELAGGHIRKILEAFIKKTLNI